MKSRQSKRRQRRSVRNAFEPRQLPDGREQEAWQRGQNCIPQSFFTPSNMTNIKGFRFDFGNLCMPGAKEIWWTSWRGFACGLYPNTYRPSVKMRTQLSNNISHFLFAKNLDPCLRQKHCFK
ncbi:hypothetical protein MHYP_G00151680 [Metynnis hypsauchen]